MTRKTGGIVGPRVFRVAGWELWPVVTEDVKAALEGAGVTGLTYEQRLTSP